MQIYASQQGDHGFTLRWRHMNVIKSQFTSHSTVCLTAYTDSHHTSKKHQSPHYWSFVRGIHRWPVNSPHKRPVTRKKLPWWRHHGSSHVRHQPIIWKNADLLSVRTDRSKFLWNYNQITTIFIHENDLEKFSDKTSYLQSHSQHKVAPMPGDNFRWLSRQIEHGIWNFPKRIFVNRIYFATRPCDQSDRRDKSCLFKICP